MFNYQGSDVKQFIECPCRGHAWPINKEDIGGLESSLIELIATNRMPKCIKYDLSIQDLLTDSEIKSLMKRKILPESVLTGAIDISVELQNALPSKGRSDVDNLMYVALLGKLLCEVIQIDVLVQDEEFINSLIPTRIQMCTRFPVLATQWETWEHQHGAYPKEFVTRMLCTLHSDATVSFEHFIRALLSIKSIKGRVKHWIEKWLGGQVTVAENVAGRKWECVIN